MASVQLRAATGGCGILGIGVGAGTPDGSDAGGTGVRGVILTLQRQRSALELP